MVRASCARTPTEGACRPIDARGGGSGLLGPPKGALVPTQNQFQNAISRTLSISIARRANAVILKAWSPLHANHETHLNFELEVDRLHTKRCSTDLGQRRRPRRASGGLWMADRGGCYTVIHVGGHSQAGRFRPGRSRPGLWERRERMGECDSRGTNGGRLGSDPDVHAVELAGRGCTPTSKNCCPSSTLIKLNT